MKQVTHGNIGSLWFAQRILWFVDAFALDHPKMAKLQAAVKHHGELAAEQEKSAPENLQGE